MTRMRLGRYTTWIICIALLALGLGLRPAGMWGWALVAVSGLFVAIGLWDIVQREHAVLRNYPVIGHVRWLVEMVRPEIRQYLLESEDEATPFSRLQRSLVYRRAKGISSDHPFGTLVDVYARDYEFVQHSACPADPPDPRTFRISSAFDTNPAVIYDAAISPRFWRSAPIGPMPRAATCSRWGASSR